MRFTAYAGTSMVLATGVVIRALHQRANFYSASVYLAQSNACLMVCDAIKPLIIYFYSTKMKQILTNLVLLGLCTVMLGLQKLFYGPLRPIEIEQLYEKAWFAVTETCLAMTIFRDEVGAWFLVMFVSLLVGKVWAWIGEGRVEILEQQPPADPRLFHARLSFSLIISSLFNVFLLQYSIKTVLLQARPNMMVMFAFEFAVLTVTSLSTSTRYLISLYESYVISFQIDGRRAQLRHTRQRTQADTPNSEHNTPNARADGEQIIDDTNDALEIDVPGWEEKGRWVFYLDLATDFLKLTLYLTFFCVLCMFYGMPIHIIRDVALTIRSFYKRINDFIRYRQATRDMNARYPDATSDEISGEDVCIICREDMHPWQPPSSEQFDPTYSNNENDNHHTNLTLDERLRPKKLPCGHVLHFSCLRSWLERQQNCPTCRAPVLVHDPVNSAAGANPPIGPDIRPQNQAQPLQGHIQAHNEIQQPAMGQNVFNFGPFRLAFGARQGFPQPNNIPNQPDQHAPIPVAAELQRISNVFRMFRQYPVSQNQAVINSPRSSMQIQLQQIEQQLMRDISDIRAQADQLFLVRALQGELARLRTAHETLEPVTSSTQAAPSDPSSFQHPHLNSHMVSATQIFSSDHRQEILDPGHQRLPIGMTIPNGWSVLPLQRLPDRSSLNPSLIHPLEALDGYTHRNNSSTIQHPILQSAADSGAIRDPSDSLRGIRRRNSLNPVTMASQRNTYISLGAQSDESSTLARSADRDNDVQSSSNDATPQIYSNNIVQGLDFDAEDAFHKSRVKPVSSKGTPIFSNHDERQLGGSSYEDKQDDSPRKRLLGDHEVEAFTPLIENSKAKGKGKAATVEDFVEDVD